MDDWIKAGTPVIVFNVLLGDLDKKNPAYRATFINRVAVKSFTVQSPHEPRFSTETHQGTREISKWTRNTRKVVPAASDEGKFHMARINRLRVLETAREAAREWLAHPSKGARHALIESLQAVDGG